MNSLIPQIKIPHPDGYLYIVTDSHLDQTEAPVDEFVDMLFQLEQPKMVVCLGDLFKVWLALPKFWAPMHQKLMKAFKKLQSRQVEIVFVIGNREAVFPRVWNKYWQTQFPFNHLIPDQCYLMWGNFRYGFSHGDGINSNDINHLRWRKIVRSRGFEWFFRLMPSPLARKIAAKIEMTLNTSNQAFKIQFPEKEVKQFAKSVLHDVDYYFLGHFHQDREFQFPDLKGCLRVVPDWLSTRSVLQIDQSGKVQTLLFKNNGFQGDQYGKEK